MFYALCWYVHGQHTEPLRAAAAGVLLAGGAAVREADPGAGLVTLDYAFAVPGPRANPPLRLAVRRLWPDPPWGEGKTVMLSLTCGAGVLHSLGERARRNLRWLIDAGDGIYAAIRPYFGWCDLEGGGDPETFLATGLPVASHFVYVGPHWLHKVKIDDLRRYPVITVSLPGGGMRVENPARHPLLPQLDLRGCGGR